MSRRMLIAMIVTVMATIAACALILTPGRFGMTMPDVSIEAVD